MNLHIIDWAILGTVILFILTVAYRTKKYMRGVADFLAANRCAGKYLLGVADGAQALGAIGIIAWFEMYYKAGFTGIWWEAMGFPLWTILAVVGWVQYRYRQTRALTMAQFLEMRYSRNFRVFAGLMSFTSGIINFGIFPSVGARFFQYFCGLPSYEVFFGPIQIDLIYAIIMFILLAISLSMTFMGGQITILVTDFVQAVFCNTVLIVIAVYLLFFRFDWTQIIAGVSTAPSDASLINPAKTGGVDNFSVWYYLIIMFSAIVNYMAWQGNQGYFASAKSPHDAKVGRVIGGMRWFPQKLAIILLPICAYAVLNGTDFSDIAASVNNILGNIDNEKLRDQVRVTVFASKILPVGLSGLFAAVMFAAFASTHDTYLHSWGSIFIQDVVIPVRRIVTGKNKPIAPDVHLKMLKYSVVGVAIFVYIFSLLFNHKQDIFMFFALTGTVFLGWAGWTIVGGLYWKYGNSIGAWAASFVGIFIALFNWFMIYSWLTFQGLCLKFAPDIWNSLILKFPALTGDKCPANAQILFLFCLIITGLVYVITSLVTGKGKVFNMDRMLNRGKYVDKSNDIAMPATGLAVFKMGKEFTLGDKILYCISYITAFGFFSIAFTGTILFLSGYEISDSTWASFWWGAAMVFLVWGTIVATWIHIGGFLDLKNLFKRLSTMKRDDSDNGIVTHYNEDNEFSDDDNSLKMDKVELK